jgi:hypothetical protein
VSETKGQAISLHSRKGVSQSGNRPTREEDRPLKMQ